MGSVEFTVNDPGNPKACGVLTVARELLDDPGFDAAGYVGLRLMRIYQGKEEFEQHLMFSLDDLEFSGNAGRRCRRFREAGKID